MSCGMAEKGTTVWYWAPRGARSPRPVRGSAAGIGYLKVGEFTVSAPPVPRRESGPGTSAQRRRGPSAARRGVGRGRRHWQHRYRNEPLGRASHTTPGLVSLNPVSTTPASSHLLGPIDRPVPPGLLSTWSFHRRGG